MTEYAVKEGEHVDFLRAGRHIIQKQKGFKFGIDAVLLADFAKPKKKDALCDLCSGGGIVPVLLSGRARRIVGVELPDEYVDMGNRSIKANGLSDTKLLQGDLREIEKLLPVASFDVVTVNPPYLKEGGGEMSLFDEINIAKQEICLKIEDVARAGAHLLIPNGRLYMVHRPDRLCDIFCALRAENLEPKRVRMVYPAKGKPPSLILIEARLSGLAGILFEAPLIVMEDGEETAEIKEIYGGRE